MGTLFFVIIPQIHYVTHGTLFDPIKRRLSVLRINLNRDGLAAQSAGDSGRGARSCKRIEDQITLVGVIRSFNRDLPYNRFILEQLAADQLALGADKSPLAALGFLTLGRRFDSDLYDIVDDRIDVTSRGFMALTVTCARCHDHKYDPIPTEDYYSLYGVFASSFQPEILPLLQQPVQSKAYEEFQAGFKKHTEAFFDYLREKREDLMDQFRTGVGDYLAEVNETEEEPEAHIYLSYAPGELRPPIIYRWYVYLKQAAASGHPVFTPWHRLLELEDEHFESQVQNVLDELAERPAREVNPVVLAALVGNPPRSMTEVAHRYGQVFRDQYEIDKQRKTPEEDAVPPLTQATAAEQEVLAVLFAEDSPTFFPAEETRHLIDRKYMNENWKRRQELQKFQVDSPGAPPRAPVLEDAAEPIEPRVFTRGDPNLRGRKVPRQWLRLLAGDKREPFQRGSGRLELARTIASDQNPLTARILVNRVWMHHFGKALVRTAGDFGTRSDPPTHPQLLDYLAWRLMDDDWSIKRLHRRMVLTRTYQQSSVLDFERQQQDPENRLLWRMNPQRLEWEVIRDAPGSFSSLLASRISHPESADRGNPLLPFLDLLWRRRYQPVRYSRLTNCSALGTPWALSFLAFHRIVSPLRKATLPNSTASVSDPE